MVARMKKDIRKKYNKIIVLAEREEALRLKAHVNMVVAALGHPEALVTDESYVSDFLSFIHHEPLGSQLRRKELKKACKKLKMEIGENELVIDVAKRMLKNE